ncbi:GNAT family N-acetyltransferase [Salmonirosea aquatica]|uniref:GNAT family N-acetyltransferase n=1 Tax=Salmonirosea aquatica TaxID=2654236 RepID=A0A7C9F965_9BACT|nr:GNAT family N-acetyltransferase [Cytophagaceae bacterium SJW1-29]
MIETLDNPVWSALTSGNKHLALGSAGAKYFQPAIAPFAAVAENTREHFDNLWEVVPDNQPVALFRKEQNLTHSPWTIINRIDGFQMLFEGATPDAGDAPLPALSRSDVPQMLALTQLSPPGPFLADTIAFGGYEGIYEGGQLVAMAGRRFDSGTHVEISAVCTHPDHTGRGYARQLIHSQIRHIRAEGKLPYLHVRADNTRAHGIYRQMGFIERAAMFIYILKKNLQ